MDNGAGGNIAAVGSVVTITLISHQVPDQNFNLYLVYGANPPQLIIPNVPAVPSSPLTWHVPVTLTNPTNPCPVSGGTPCLIQSRRVISPTQIYASGEFYLNQPEIVIQGGLRTFAQNETMHITLRGHSPGLAYDLKISDGGANTVWQGRTLVADAIGEVKTPVNWTVPPTWPNGNYTISSHPATGTPPRNPASMTSANQVASLAVQVSTPSGAFITIDGGYTWPAGSVINIQANKHNQANNPYYFKFGSWRVPIPTSSPVDTFSTDASQTFVAAYRIPLTATIGVTTTFAVSSFVNATNSFVAQRNVTVLSVPVITVLEGSVVSPDTIITAKIINHVPDSTYRIFYLDKLLGEILTNATGQGQLQYDLRNLPINSPPGLSTSFGTPYPVYSQFLLTGAGVATTSLTLRAPDLRVTNIQIPSNPALNTSVPVTFTLQNTSPVTITRYFDTDLYLDPSPLVPAYQGIGQINFPGDFKYWRNFVAPNATFTITQPFFIGTYGPHRLYSYGDTSDRIFNEASELNNILSNTLTISCTPPLITDTFGVLSTTWATQLYGNGDNNAQPPQVGITGTLLITSDGSSTLGTNDSALSPVRGYTFFHKTTPITTAGGLDVRVQVLGAPNTVNGAKAGLELRDTLLPTSPKLEFGLTRSASNQYKLQVALRDSVSLAPVVTYNSTALSLATPIWLRIQRYGGTNTFLFYYVQSATAPASWGTPVHTMTIGLSNQLEYGLFVNNATSGSHERAIFDNFVVGNPASCLAAQGQPPTNNAPPGLATCTDPLSEKGFETVPTVKWLGVGTGGVLPTTSGHTGNQALLADTLRPGPNNPVFYQRFAMPSVLISTTTTVKLELFRNVEQETDGADANDRFYVVLATSPSLSATLTTPVLVSSGDQGALGYDPSKWQQVNVTLPPALGINLANYAGQNLYLYFYNNSNQTTVGCPPICHNTSFYFDDIKLEPCTVQPLPPVITTRIKGELVLHPSAGSAQKKAGVEVWAYAEGGQLYKTVTIQNGEFNFYNLPATTTGIRYFIYAEHFITSSLDPTQIETLTANASVVLTNANNDANPVITRLDLY